MMRIKSALLVLFLSLLYKTGWSQSYRISERTKIYTQKVPGDSVLLKADNDLFIPVTLKVSLELNNLISEDTPDIAVIIPPKTIGKTIAVMRQLVSSKPYSCTFNWRINPGDTSKTPDPDYIYAFPYLKGNNYRVTQGPGGNFSHKDIFAFDFAMPLRTPVCAARDGIVAFVKSDSDIGGPDKKYIDDANFISVYHKDGSMANYYHLSSNGATVKEGQVVKKGQIIGYSGNTGFSDGAHLHFEVVQANASTNIKNWIKFRWESPTDNALTIMRTKTIPENKAL